MTLALKCPCVATKCSSKTLGVTHRLNLYVAGSRLHSQDQNATVETSSGPGGSKSGFES